MITTTQPQNSLSASAATPNFPNKAQKEQPPHTFSSRVTTIKFVASRIKAAEKAISVKFLGNVKFYFENVDENGALSIIFEDLSKKQLIEAISTNWKTLHFNTL